MIDLLRWRLRRWVHRNCVIELHGDAVCYVRILGPVQIRGTSPIGHVDASGNRFYNCKFSDDPPAMADIG